jgi:hypothetical protein
VLALAEKAVASDIEELASLLALLAMDGVTKD